MNALSEELRDLMARHKLTGVQLAKDIGLSGTSVSQILTGKTRPRQVTLSRMMKRLCEDSKDEQALLSAYETSGSCQGPLSPILSDAQNAAEEELRVRRFMEMKTQSIAFRREVARELVKTKLPFQQEHSEGSITTDFLLKLGDKRIALECRANVHRDLEKALLSARIIRDELRCNQVFIVVPRADEELRKACFSKSNIQEMVLKRLISGLRDLSEKGLNKKPASPHE